VFSRTCRTCHVAQPFTAPVFTNKVDFQNDIGAVQSRVCSQKVMPHAKRTNDVFWTSVGPNMPAFLQLYGQTLPGWVSVPDSQCGLFFQGGADVQSEFTTVVYPVLANRCAGCHGVVGNANWSLGTAAATYNSLLTATAKDGVSKYIVPNNSGASLLFQRISHGPSQMPLGGPDLTVTGNPPEATRILTWINHGAGGP
jgi:mono/diheme cytochrome c family protein